MTDALRRDALVRSLCARLCDERRSLDELRVIDVVLSRLELGADLYGQLDLSKPRDWAREAAEEVADERFYRACQTLWLRDEHRTRIEQGLVEIRRQTSWPAQDWPGEHELGGES